MILLSLLDLVYNLFSSLFNAIFQALPDSVSSMIVYMMDFMKSGLDIVFTIFFNQSYVTALLGWIVGAWLVMLGVDLVWRIINIIKLKRSEGGNNGND